MYLSASTQESEDRDEQEQEAFHPPSVGISSRQWGESICVSTLLWLHDFLSPSPDSVRLFEDMVVIHTQKYILRLLKSHPSFVLLAWLAGVGIHAF